VADIVSPIWHDEKERDDAGEPNQLVRLLGIKSGITVADIGAGSGYYVVRLSPIVGPRGRIIAQDVVPKYLWGLRRRVRDFCQANDPCFSWRPLLHFARSIKYPGVKGGAGVQVHAAFSNRCPGGKSAENVML